MEVAQTTSVHEEAEPSELERWKGSLKSLDAWHLADATGTRGHPVIKQAALELLRQRFESADNDWLRRFLTGKIIQRLGFLVKIF